MREIDTLLRDSRLWRARQASDEPNASGIASGFAALDQALPGGGWPTGALTELVCEAPGIGEISLLLPALIHLANTRAQSWTVWVAPPHMLYAPALVHGGVDLSRTLVVHARQSPDVAWAMEQALRCGACSAVLGWLNRVDDRTLRRLQLAAQSSDAFAVVFRSAQVLKQSSPALLRAHLMPQGEAMRVRILKCRGSAPSDILIKSSALHASAPGAE